MNVAVPDVMGAFGIGQDRVQWLSTGALAAMTIGMNVGTPSVRTTLTHDIYLTLEPPVRQDSGQARIKVFIKPMILWLWVGTFVMAIGTLLGGALGDRFGRKAVIWGSIVGVLPFALAPRPDASLAHRAFRTRSASRSSYAMA